MTSDGRGSGLNWLRYPSPCTKRVVAVAPAARLSNWPFGLYVNVPSPLFVTKPVRAGRVDREVCVSPASESVKEAVRVTAGPFSFAVTEIATATGATSEKTSGNRR